jgi:hypothetical protein
MEERKVQVVLFGVQSDGDLKREYKELANLEEFKDLNPNEVKFCWLVGNRTSPIFNLERGERIRKALNIVWGSNYKLNPKIKELSKATGEDDIPEDILRGIFKMNTYNPSLRLKAKLMSEYIFETLNELIVLDSAEMHSMDIDDRKKYADFVIKVSSELQGMVDRLESSYGVQTIDRETKEEVRVNISDVMH